MRFQDLGAEGNIGILATLQGRRELSDLAVCENPLNPPSMSVPPF